MTLLFIFISPLFAQAKEEGWKEHRSRHFYIYYKNVPIDFVKTVEGSAECYYKEITRRLGFTRYKDWSFDDRAKIYIYQDKMDYLTSAKQAGWSVGAVDIRKKIIRTFPLAHGFFDTTLPHELGHIIFREFVGIDTALPRWLDEGVAMFQEKARRWGSDDVVKKAIEEDRFIPLKKLTRLKLKRSVNNEDVELFYAEAASVVYYMIKELGEHRFARFCRMLKEGQSFERALKENYSRIETVEDLNKLWIKYLKNK